MFGCLANAESFEALDRLEACGAEGGRPSVYIQASSGNGRTGGMLLLLLLFFFLRFFCSWWWGGVEWGAVSVSVGVGMLA